MTYSKEDELIIDSLLPQNECVYGIRFEVSVFCRVRGQSSACTPVLVVSSLLLSPIQGRTRYPPQLTSPLSPTVVT